ncbi:hypothetical protein MA16_Dca019237 [Dendrobium catenatum]|uniref:FLZ-type domain-containing protein n=1 Tax=Dendrobium catenatum TaxID=906689 RepID=A0A2I0W3M1_9ASPA|nr:hypothetical protein MA16_Dca019237 [Dendrobium catenatum]
MLGICWLSSVAHMRTSSSPYLLRERNLPELTPPKPVRFFFDDLSDDESNHFLDFCFLYKKQLGGNRDIYMYRGDTLFCSIPSKYRAIPRKYRARREHSNPGFISGWIVGPRGKE